MGKRRESPGYRYCCGYRGVVLGDHRPTAERRGADRFGNKRRGNCRRRRLQVVSAQETCAFYGDFRPVRVCRALSCDWCVVHFAHRNRRAYLTGVVDSARAGSADIRYSLLRRVRRGAVSVLRQRADSLSDNIRSDGAFRAGSIRRVVVLSVYSVVLRRRCDVDGRFAEAKEGAGREMILRRWKRACVGGGARWPNGNFTDLPWTKSGV